MTQEGFVSKGQREKRYDGIPLRLEAPGLLFRTTQDAHFHLQDGSRVPLNQHLGNLLREYIQLLILALDNQSQRVDNRVFPLCSADQEYIAAAKQEVRDCIEECETLQQQLRTFKGVWVANKAGFPSHDCYSDSPAQWVDTPLHDNQAIVRARKNIDKHNMRQRELQYEWIGWRQKPSM